MTYSEYAACQDNLFIRDNNVHAVDMYNVHTHPIHLYLIFQKSSIDG